MTEETNQGMATEVEEIAAGVDTNATELPESLFEDTDTEPETRAHEDVTENEAEDVAKETAQVKETAGTEATPQMLKVKFNGEEKEISIEEAITLAQKGMNYDHVASERDIFKATNETIKRCAKESGVSVEQFVASLEAETKRAARNDELRRIEDEYPDLPEDAMDELAELRIEKKNRELAEVEAQENQRTLDARTKPWRDFIKEYPDVSVKELPDTVIKEIEGGKTPVDAYQKHLISELEAKIQTAEQTGMNKARAVGSARGDAVETNKDSFLEGFFGN